MALLRVRVGTSTKDSDLKDISVNTNEAMHIQSEVFDGHILVHIKDLPDSKGCIIPNEYFEKRENVTWSIQVQGAY